MFSKETMSVEEYENGVEQINFHYKREDRLNMRRNKSYPGSGSSYSSGGGFALFGGKSNRKKRNKMMSYIHLMLLGLVVIIFFGYNFVVKPGLLSKWFGNDNGSAIDVKISTISLDESTDEGSRGKNISFYLFITNGNSEQISLNLSKDPVLSFMGSGEVLSEYTLSLPDKVSLTNTDGESAENSEYTYTYNEDLSIPDDVLLDERFDEINLTIDFEETGEIIATEKIK